VAIAGYTAIDRRSQTKSTVCAGIDRPGISEASLGGLAEEVLSAHQEEAPPLIEQRGPRFEELRQPTGC
jgi:hypothetical protein